MLQRDESVCKRGRQSGFSTFQQRTLIIHCVPKNVTLTIGNMEKMVWKLIRLRIYLIFVDQGLCENKVLHRHVCIVFLPNPPIAILELPNCFSHERLTFLKRCYWLVRQEYNKHVTMKVLISA